MSDDLKLRRDMDRASQAKALLDNPMLTEAFATYEADLMKVWFQTKVAASDERERIWWAVQAARAARNALVSVVSNGRLAQAQIDALAGRRAA